MSVTSREPEQRYAHPLFTHPDGQQCIWSDNSGWFVPYDVGGEGADCSQWHPGDDERRTLLTIRGTLSNGGGAEPDDAEAAEFITTALRAAQVGNAGHWPTVAAILAEEVTRLRATLDDLTTAISPSTSPPPTAANEMERR
jgi:hypothetical protein